jgi:hypothetical protein
MSERRERGAKSRSPRAHAGCGPCAALGLLACAGSAALGGCADVPDEEPAALAQTRVLGVVAEPPEAAPGDMVSLELVLAGPHGPVERGSAIWTFCRTPKALREPGFASAACLEGQDRPLAAQGLMIDAQVPDDACTLFSGRTDADLRPRDPDATGGYYQPLRVRSPDGELTLARLRLLCPLTDAPIAVVQAYAQKYVANRAPTITDVEVDGETLGADAGSEQTLSGAELELVVRAGEGARERYLLFDRTQGKLIEREEQLTASWFVSAGTLSTAESELDTRGLGRARLRPDPRHKVVSLWVLVRDDRGGLSYASRRLRVAE